MRYGSDASMTRAALSRPPFPVAGTALAQRSDALAQRLDAPAHCRSLACAPSTASAHWRYRAAAPLARPAAPMSAPARQVRRFPHPLAQPPTPLPQPPAVLPPPRTVLPPPHSGWRQLPTSLAQAPTSLMWKAGERTRPSTALAEAHARRQSVCKGRVRSAGSRLQLTGMRA